MHKFQLISGLLFGALLMFPSPGLAVDRPVPPEDKAVVDKLVDQLSADDASERERAGIALEDRPDCDLQLIQAAGQRDDLGPEAKSHLKQLLARMEPRVKAHDKESITNGIIFGWYSKTLAAEYDGDGHTDPKWDVAAKKAIQLDALRADRPTPAERDQVFKDEREALDAAVTAGCDDPAVLVIDGLVSNDLGVSADQVFNLFRKALTVSERGKVNPYTKVIIDGRVLRGRAAGYDGGITKENSAASGALMRDMIAQYQQLMALPNVPAQVMVATAANVIRTGIQIRMPRKYVFDLVYPPLEKALPNEAGVLQLKGSFYIDYAWEARGGGWANTVTEQGWKDFADRLATAQEVLTKAWDLDPTNPTPPTRMLTVALGLNYDRDAMEKWYQRAMDANPDNYDACSSKLYYLEPKWHGSADDMLEFGHQCFESRNWRNNVAFILVDAHIALSKYEKDPKVYFRNENVWSDLSTVYSTYLDAYPNDAEVRSKYAYYACLAHRWNVANELFQKLGNDAWPNVFGGDDQLKDFKTKAAESSSNSTTKP